jgi:hypothetical protein
VRERSSKEVYEVVLNDPEPSVSLVVPRDRRYVVCRNLNEAKCDAEVREAVLRSLRKSLRKSLRGGDKALVGNSASRRYLKTPDDKHFEIDEKRVAEDARYDGLYVLRTNMRLDALSRKNASVCASPSSPPSIIWKSTIPDFCKRAIKSGLKNCTHSEMLEWRFLEACRTLKSASNIRTLVKRNDPFDGA